VPVTGPSDQVALAAEGLTVRYGDNLALDGVTFSLPAGTTTAVIGPNGSGKSTLLHAVMGLTPIAGGTIRGNRSGAALVLQSTDVDRSLPITVLETVRMARYGRLGLFRRFRDDDHAAVRSSLERVAIADLAHRQLHDLSGGQRQRVLVAQGLAQEADLLLLDEPVTGLDVVSRQVILEVMADETARGHTVVMTTHSLDDARRCDQVLLLASRAIAFGSPDQVIREDHLRAAFGGRVLRLADGELLMDDPHHVH
jgi:iron complex transport system ATP-binding protein